MSIRHLVASIAITVLTLFAALPARAGIPVIDGANLAQQIQQVISWTTQAQQMLDQLNKLQQQVQQMQTMTAKLDGIRNLGSILNDPTVTSLMPAEIRDASQLLLNPAALAISQANLDQIRAAFGVQTTGHPGAGQSAADALGKAQQILAATQSRGTQLVALANRVNTTADAKDSLDMVNRNVLEAANINNQMVQTMASLEATRQAAELKRIADNQAYFSAVKSGGSQPLRTFSY